MSRLQELYEEMVKLNLIANKKDFAEKFGFAYANLARYLNGQLKTTIDSENYRKFADAGINIDWLLTGEGEMFSTSSTGALVSTEVMRQDEVANIPYYDIDVMAHIAESLDLKDEVPAGVLSIPGFQDCIACFPVYGSSMEPKISSGDVIAVSQAVSCDQILWGEIYLVITDAWRVVKTVHPGVTEEYIILRSINPAYAGDTNVNKKDLRALYLVRGVVSRLGM